MHYATNELVQLLAHSEYAGRIRLDFCQAVQFPSDHFDGRLDCFVFLVRENYNYLLPINFDPARPVLDGLILEPKGKAVKNN